MNSVLLVISALLSGALSDAPQGGSFVQDSYTAPLNAGKETYSAPSGSYETPQTYSYNAPSAPPSGGAYNAPSAPPSGSYYASDYPPAAAHSTHNGFGFGGNTGLGFPNAQNLISTGLSIAIGIFFVSLVFQMLSKLAASNIFDKIFNGLFGDEDARYFDQGTIDQLTNLAVDAIHKFREQYEEESTD